MTSVWKNGTITTMSVTDDGSVRVADTGNRLVDGYSIVEVSPEGAAELANEHEAFAHQLRAVAQAAIQRQDEL
jgi:hypothetical protein